MEEYRFQQILPPHLYDAPPSDTHSLVSVDISEPDTNTRARKILANERGFMLEWNPIIASINGSPDLTTEQRKELEFLVVRDNADRSVNQLKAEMVKDSLDQSRTSVFGKYYVEAREDAQFSDHGGEHVRRMELLSEAMWSAIPELRHGTSIQQWLPSSYLALEFHDLDQLLSQKRNRDNLLALKRGERLPPGEQTNFKTKQAHDLAASVMTLAITRKYAKAARISMEEAWKITSGAAVMEMKHGSPEHFKEVFSQRNPAYVINNIGERTPLTGEDLIASYNSHSIDITSLSPAQLVEVLVYEKNQAGFVNGSSMYGLHPVFEAEYSEELADLSGDSNPLFPALDEGDRISLVLAAEVKLRADLGEMIAPATDALIRTLITPKAKGRPYFRHRDVEEQMTDILTGPTHVDDKTINSDVRRKYWETVRSSDVDPDSIIGRSEYNAQFTRDSIMMGIISLKIVGQELLQRDHTFLNGHYERRISALGEKALRKIGLNMVINQGAEWAIPEVLRWNGKAELANLFAFKANTLREEQARLLGLLEQKYAMVDHNPDELEGFLTLYQRMMDEMKQRLQVSDTEIAQYEQMVSEGVLPRSIPYQTYDRLIINGNGARLLYDPSTAGF